MLRRGCVGEANEVAAWLVETARSRLADRPETPENLCDLSVPLNNVGNTDQQPGDWQGAREAFTESLEIARHLAKVLPRHQDYKDPPDWFERRLAAAQEEENRD